VIYAKIAGFLHELAPDPNKLDRPAYDRRIDMGSRVLKDQLLAELSVPETEEERKQKEAMVRQVEAELEQSKKALAASVAGIAAAQAHVNEAKAALSRAQALYDRWRSEHDRVSRLASGGVLDTQSRDEAQNQFKAAEATLNEAMAKVSSAKAGVTKAEADRDKVAADGVAVAARLDVVKADVRRIEAQLEYTKVKAPFDGVVTKRLASTGDLITADRKHALFCVAKLDPVRVVVNVPEADSGLVQLGQNVHVTLQALAATPTTGKVVRTSWALEPGSRTLRAEVDLPNPESKVRPGMYVSTRLTVELPSEWAVPTAALAKINDEPVVYLVEGGKAVRVVVQLHRGDGHFTQLRRYKRPDSLEWTDITGEERIATPASAITSGQAIP
jgi:multidrug efflux pump subunit AcrA (membrane-fusion protein)